MPNSPRRQCAVTLLALALILVAPENARAQGMAMAPPAPDSVCRLSPGAMDAMLDADYEAFDQSPNGATGWRPMLNKGCYMQAAEIIEAYVRRNRSRLSHEATSTLHFHAGQALALGGRDSLSVPQFALARGSADTEEWNAYVDGTIAFLQKDSVALESARARYERATRPGAPRLRVLDALRACLSRPYAEAVMCPPARR